MSKSFSVEHPDVQLILCSIYSIHPYSALLKICKKVLPAHKVGTSRYSAKLWFLGVQVTLWKKFSLNPFSDTKIEKRSTYTIYQRYAYLHNAVMQNLSSLRSKRFGTFPLVSFTLHTRISKVTLLHILSFKFFEHLSQEPTKSYGKILIKCNIVRMFWISGLFRTLGNLKTSKNLTISKMFKIFRKLNPYLDNLRKTISAFHAISGIKA